MIVVTSGGNYSVVEDRENPKMLVVHSLNESALQILVDGVAVLQGGEDLEIRPVELGKPELGSIVVVSRDLFADWLSFEVMQYLDYPEMDAASSFKAGIIV